MRASGTLGPDAMAFDGRLERFPLDALVPLTAIRAIALPVVTGIIEMGVLRDCYGNAGRPGFHEAPIALPVFTPIIEIAVFRHRYFPAR